MKIFGKKNNMELDAWAADLVEKYGNVEKEKNELNNSTMKKFSHFKVNDFKVDLKWQNEVKNMVIHYIQKQSYKNTSLCLFGCSGSGKTHLSCAIGNYLIQHDFKVVRHDFNHLAQIYTRFFFNGDSLEKFFNNHLKKMYGDFIIIEDFLKDNSINAKRAAFSIIDYLYINQIPFVINGEISIKKLMEEEIAIYGRIKQMSKNYIFEIPNHIKNNYRLRE